MGTSQNLERFMLKAQSDSIIFYHICYVYVNVYICLNIDHTLLSCKHVYMSLIFTY